MCVSASISVMGKACPKSVKRKNVVVQHNYHDHAGDAPPAGDSSLETLRRSGANAAFPLKLHDMLTYAEEEGISHIVSFAPHGRALHIHDTNAFRDLLPRYFTHTTASFQRQLNLYGFSRLTRGPDRGSYYHECFLRGMPWLIHNMSRVKVKGTGVRARSNPDQEPDFWKMRWAGVPSESQKSPVKVPSSSVQSSAEIKIQHIDTQDTSTFLCRGISTSSVVSQEDHDNNGCYEPHPDSPKSTCSLVGESTGSEDQPDLILSGWGMPFHYLGSLAAFDSINSDSSPILYPCFPAMVEAIDDAELDQALGKILEDGDGDFNQR